MRQGWSITLSQQEGLRAKGGFVGTEVGVEGMGCGTLMTHLTWPSSLHPRGRSAINELSHFYLQ